MSEAANIRKYIEIVEREKMLNEGEYLPMRHHTLRINISDYDMLRTLLHLPEPENYTNSNYYGNQKILTFWDRLSYQDVVSKLKKFGIKVHEEPHGCTTFWDKELTPDTENKLSPYPSNMSIQGHWGDPNRTAADAPKPSKSTSAKRKRQLPSRRPV